jgi:hypothetical protein
MPPDFLDSVRRIKMTIDKPYMKAVDLSSFGRAGISVDCEVVGAERFELPTLWSQTRCATRLRYAPTIVLICNFMIVTKGL